MAVFLYLLSVVAVLLSAIYLSFKKTYKFWANLNVPYVEPVFPFGNFKECMKKRHFGHITRELYEKVKSKGDYVGVFVFKKPTLFVTSPEFVKTVLVRDFNTFVDRGMYSNRKTDPLSANLFFLDGEEWRSLRQKLTPAFTSGKMKLMFHSIIDVSNELVQHIEQNTTTEGNDVDVHDLMARFTTDVISSCIFGLESKSIENPDAEFRRVGKKLFKLSKFRSFLTFAAISFKDIARQLGLRMFDRESTEFFTDLVHKTIGFRHESHIHRNDMMQILMELMREDFDSDEGLTIDEIAANAFLFFFAGFETSSTTLTFALFNLAMHKDIQDAARKEVNEIYEKHNKQMDYEDIIKAELLERIIFETLRMHPPVATVHRVSNNSYKLPNDAEIPKDLNVIIPVLGLHYDKDIYPDPEKFDPDRFTEQNKFKRHPYAFIPFGEGPRMCLGLRFALMQIKVGLATLLRNFHIELCEKTEIPVKMDNVALTYVPEGSVWLCLRKI